MKSTVLQQVTLSLAFFEVFRIIYFTGQHVALRLVDCFHTLLAPDTTDQKKSNKLRILQSYQSTQTGWSNLEIN